MVAWIWLAGLVMFVGGVLIIERWRVVGLVLSYIGIAMVGILGIAYKLIK